MRITNMDLSLEELNYLLSRLRASCPSNRKIHNKLIDFIEADIANKLNPMHDDYVGSIEAKMFEMVG